MHRAARRFWRCYHDLPPEVQKLADEKFDLLNNDHSHPSLHFKKVGKVWAVRVGRGHRALAFHDGEDYLWFWIGGHDKYERIIQA